MAILASMPDSAVVWALIAVPFLAGFWLRHQFGRGRTRHLGHGPIKPRKRPRQKEVKRRRREVRDVAAHTQSG